MTELPYRTFTCSYPFQNNTWGFNIKARTHDEAVARLKAIGWGKVDGEVGLVIQVEAASGRPDLFERMLMGILCGWANFKSRWWI